jgi:hypothetical protein
MYIYGTKRVLSLPLSLNITAALVFLLLEYNDRATDKQHGYRLNLDHATGLYVTPVVEEKGSGSCFS